MHRKAYLLLLTATLCWGGNVVAGKIAVGHVSPLMLSALRWCGAFLLLPFGWQDLARDRLVIRKNLAYLLLMGMVGMGAFNGLMYIALNHTTAINASILQAVIPMVVFAVNFLVYKVRTGLAQIIGFLFTVLGVALIAGEGSLTRLLQLGINFGDGLMIVNVFFYGCFIVALRRMPKIHWKSTMLVLFAGAALVSSLCALAEFAVGAGQWPDRTGLLAVLYIILFPSIVAQTLLVLSSGMIGANRTGLFINLVPVFGTLLSILILSERFIAYHALSLVLVLCGIALAERFRPAEPGQS